MNRIDTIEYWWYQYNETEFNDKLKPVGFGLTRSTATDGYFEHYPGTNRKSRIVISKHCFADEDHLCGTILHEMLHQYQYEILKRKCNHDAIFTSMARRLERKHKFTVR
jgi:hypothetical protein